MDENKIQMYLSANSKFFDGAKLSMIGEKLKTTDDSKFILLSSQDLKDPTILLIVSLLFGSLGIDRFMVGDIGLGVLKLLTGGLCGVLTIIDWFIIMNKTKEVNYNKVMSVL